MTDTTGTREMADESGEPNDGVIDSLHFAPDLLKGKVALVTGGGSGLGQSMAYRFAALGAKVVVGSRKEQNLRATCERIKTIGGDAAWKVTDVKDPKQAFALVEHAHETFGKLDIVVNNSAGNFIARSEKLSENAYQSVVGTVLNGSFMITQAAGRKWIAKKTPGVVLSIVTNYAWTGAPFVVPSAVAKAGVLAMTRSLAVEWAKHGIRLNALAPGPIPTKGAWDRLMPTDSFVEEVCRHIPLGRLGSHAELCDVATFLVSEASSYITGQVVSMDGGEWLVGSAFQKLREVPDEMWEAWEEARSAARAQAGKNKGT